MLCALQPGRLHRNQPPKPRVTSHDLLRLRPHLTLQRLGSGNNRLHCFFLTRDAQIGVFVEQSILRIGKKNEGGWGVFLKD